MLWLPHVGKLELDCATVYSHTMLRFVITRDTKSERRSFGAEGRSENERRVICCADFFFSNKPLATTVSVIIKYLLLDIHFGFGSDSPRGIADSDMIRTCEGHWQNVLAPVSACVLRRGSFWGSKAICGVVLIVTLGLG